MDIEKEKLPDPYEKEIKSGSIIEVGVGETFTIQGICKIKVDDFQLNKKMDSFYTDWKGNRELWGSTNSWICFEIENISHERLTDAGFTINLQYINENGHYTYSKDPFATGPHLQYGIEKNHEDDYLKPMKKSYWVVGFLSVPESVRTSTDGYIAVSFYHYKSSSVPYIIYFRRPE